MTAAPERPTVGVVVLAWKDEPYLVECVKSVLTAADVDVRLVLVDNGCRPDDIAAVPADDRITLLEPGTNTGFAGGCNLAVAALATEFVALVNSDCVLQSDTLAQLVAEARRPDVGPVMASIRLAEPPYLLNSAGNPVHLVGLSWAGEMNQPETRTEPFDVTGASGACVLMRRAVWTDLGGFDEEYFAYLEDTEMSLRAWGRGLAARCVPTALALHHYEFSRNKNKMYLLERNRIMLVTTLWSRRALVVLGPMLLLIELMLAVYALVSGWGPQKVKGWAWVWRHRGHIRERRKQLQAERTTPDEAWMGHLTTAFDRQAFGPLTPIANLVFRVYWAVGRRLV